MSLQEHIQKLQRLAHQMISDRMQKEELFGAALDGSLATGRIWETSDVDFSIFPTYSQYDQDVEWRAYESVVVHIHVTSKKVMDNLIEKYPQSFIESAKSGYFTLDPTWLLDGLAIMSIVYDPTGYLAQVKEFVKEHRFSPEVLKERLRLMLEYVNGKISEAEKALTNGDHRAFLNLLYSKTGLACSMGHMWLEAHRRIYSSKEQDLQLAEVAQEAKLPQVHSLYRAILGLDLSDRMIEEILKPIDEYATIVDKMYQIVEESAVEQNLLDNQDKIEGQRTWRLHVNSNFKSLPIALKKGCYSHLAFVIGRLGPSFVEGIVEGQKRIDPSRLEEVESEAKRAKETMSKVWKLFGYIECKDRKMRYQLDSAIRLAEITAKMVANFG